MLEESFIRIWKNKDKILEGIMNSIFKKEHIEEIASYRYMICSGNDCGYFDRTGRGCAVPGTQPCCSECGCSLKLKTRSMSSYCEKGYWFAEMTEHEEEMLNDKLGMA